MKRLTTPPWKYSDNAKIKIVKWAYLSIVVIATIAMSILINQNRMIVKDIQKDRVKVTFDLCLDQNARHDELLAFVKDQAQKSGQPVSSTTIKFVNLLAEKRNCHIYVANLFDTS